MKNSLKTTIKSYPTGTLVVVVANAMTSSNYAEAVRLLCNKLNVFCVIEYTGMHLKDIKGAREYLLNKYHSANYFKVVFVTEENEITAEEVERNMTY